MNLNNKIFISILNIKIFKLIKSITIMQKFKQIMVIVFVALAFASCNQRADVAPTPQNNDGYLKTEPLCGCTDFALNDVAGTNFGTLTAFNENSAVYFNFNTTPGVANVYVWIGTDPAQMPDDYLDFPFTKTNDIVWIPFGTLENQFNGSCGNDYYFSAYAVLTDGTVVSVTDTYSAICCDVPTYECETYQTETAFGGSSAGAGKAWWFYYDVAHGNGQIIYAGQHYTIGTVSYINGQIIINLTDGWELQDVSESVKIEGYSYETIPKKRPPAGHFTWKGTSLVVDVEPFDVYVIHLDVKVCTSGTEVYPELCPDSPPLP